MTWNTVRLGCLIIVVLGIALAGCGNQSENSEESKTETLSFEGDDDFKFSPGEVMVQTGASVNVTFVNRGELDHSWVLIPNSIEPLAAGESDAFSNASSGTLPASEETMFTFNAPEAGTYTFVCTVPGHAAAGMVGLLIVTED